MQVDTSRDRGDILSEKTLKNIGEGDQVTDPTVKMAVGGLDNKVLIPGSPKSPKSLKKRQQSRKAKYDRLKCTSCRKPLKTRTAPLSKKAILHVKETFRKYSRATWKKLEQQLLTYSDDNGGRPVGGNSIYHRDHEGVIDDHYPAPPYVTKTLNPYKTPKEMRDGLGDHFAELLYPGALNRGESVQIPWTSLGQWLEINKKRLVNWPTGVRFPDSTYQMVGFWNLTEVNALFGVKIENWSAMEKDVSIPSTPLVYNQMGNTVVTISQVSQLAYGPSLGDSSSDFFSDSDSQDNSRWSRRPSGNRRFIIPAHRALGAGTNV